MTKQNTNSGKVSHIMVDTQITHLINIELPTALREIDGTSVTRDLLSDKKKHI